jgi:hypothetical protein
MWLGLFNNRSTIKQAKKFVELVEDNKTAEILLDKIKGIEHQYESVEAYKHRYEDLTLQIIYEFNYKFREEIDEVKLKVYLENEYDLKSRKIILIYNNVYAIREFITPQMEMIQQQDIAYRKLYNQICMRGMLFMFGQNTAISVCKTIEEMTGFSQEDSDLPEARVLVEHFSLKELNPADKLFKNNS